MSFWHNLAQKLETNRLKKQALFGIGDKPKTPASYPEESKVKLPDMNALHPKDEWKPKASTEIEKPELGGKNESGLQPSFKGDTGMGGANGAVNPEGKPAHITDKLD